MANLPEGARSLYRICTEKSKLGFGKFIDLTVGDIMLVDESYIAWIYYNYEKISFKKEILDALEIEPISKPGIAPEKMQEWTRRENEKYTEEERLHGRIKFKRQEKKKRLARMVQVERSVNLSKGELQAINHGHIKA